MATTYKWDFYAFDVAPSENGYTDLIKSISWKMIANNGTHQCEMHSKLPLEYPNPENFIAFENLTEEQVISWAESKVNVADFKSSLDYSLELLTNPPIITKQAPWNSTSP